MEEEGGGGEKESYMLHLNKQTTSHTYTHIMTYPRRYTHNITHCVDNTDSLKGVYRVSTGCLQGVYRVSTGCLQGVYRVSTGWGGMCLSYPW
jgi:hypothetical protein